MKDIKDNFIPWEEARQLKELGFDTECLYYYNNKELTPWGYDNDETGCLAPLWQQAFEFFREKYDLHADCPYDPRDGHEWYIEGAKTEDSFVYYSTYEEAQLECLRTLIKLCKDDKTETKG